MTVGLAISLLMHAALLGFALISFASTPERKTAIPSEAIIADVISPSELNRMRQGVREAKLDDAQAKDVKKPDEAKQDTPKPKPVTPPPVAAAEPPPPPPEPAKVEPPPPPAATPPPKPEPDKLALAEKLDEIALQKATEEKAKAAAEAKAKADAAAKAKTDAEAKAKAAEDKRKADEKKKELAEKKKRELAEKHKRELAEKKKRELAEKKKTLDTSRLSALLDKTPDPKQAPAANQAPASPTAARGPVRGDAQGRDHTISANEASFLAGLMRQAVSRCWNINAGLDGIQQMVVKIEVKLTRDGQIEGQPRVVNTQGSPVFRDAADSAVRALMQCQPYALPPDKFAGGWEHMILTFDPARMF